MVRSSSSTVSSRADEKFRILEIKILSAHLKTKRDAKDFYVNLWINPDTKLQTTVNLKGGSEPEWYEKFVFSVPEKFVDENPSTIVNFGIYQARKVLQDSLVGTARCDVKYTEKYHFGEAKYDTEKKDSEFDPSFEEEEEGTEQPPVWQRSACLEVVKGSESKGSLKVELGVWKGFISCVGKYKWRDMAMGYEDFMGLRIRGKNRKVLHYFVCFARSRASEGKPRC